VGHRKPRFTATDIGKIVSRFLTQYFTTYVDYDFTAKMEDSLDAVATGRTRVGPLLEKFWRPFIDLGQPYRNLGQPRRKSPRRATSGPIPSAQADERAHGAGLDRFVQIGTKDDEDKPRFAGLRPGQKMDLITHAQALELFKLPRSWDRLPQAKEITTMSARFGPM